MIFEPLLTDLTHARSCEALTPGNEESCTCGLKWRIRLRTEIEMHNAWRKRAEEAEAGRAQLQIVDNHGLFEFRGVDCPYCKQPIALYKDGKGGLQKQVHVRHVGNNSSRCAL